MPKPELVSSPRRNSYHGVEKAGQSYDYKYLVITDLTATYPAQIEIAAPDDANAKILGQAQSDATGVTGTAAVVDEWFDEDIIAIDCWDASDAALVAASTFVPGKLYGLLLVSGEWYADFDNGEGGKAPEPCGDFA